MVPIAVPKRAIEIDVQPVSKNLLKNNIKITIKQGVAIAPPTKLSEYLSIFVLRVEPDEIIGV